MSKYESFENIDPVDLTAKDWLALSRNKLANERTFLAYLRTGFSMIALGAVILKWFHHLDLQILGGVSIGLGRWSLWTVGCPSVTRTVGVRLTRVADGAASRA